MTGANFASPSSSVFHVSLANGKTGYHKRGVNVAE